MKEAQEAKGRNDQDEGKVGRTGESLETEDELPEELGQEEAQEEVGKQRVKVPEAGQADRPEYEARKHQIARRPVLPTKAEIDEHYPLHLHYSSWCAHCFAGKARANQQVRSNLECGFCFHER